MRLRLCAQMSCGCCALTHLIDESGWLWQAGQRLGVDGALLRGHVEAEIPC